MLELQHLSVAYRGAPPVLNDLSLTLTPGITVLIGHNGAGKSTLLHAALGEVAYTGNILLNGTSLVTYAPRERAKLLSLLPQKLPAPALCVREVVALGFAPFCTRPGEKEWQTVREILEKLEIESLSARPVQTLSGGERQKVFLALLLAQNTPVLLLDEPATYLDATFSATLYRVLREEREKGKHILLVMHDLAAALDLADRVLLLEGGKLTFDGTPQACLNVRIPERVFGLTRYRATDENQNEVYFFKA
ncbi:MAG: ABC transporter ATP-binding protein [Ruminococcaceae bacterium]|nr:ABC transporter ATP-binding protein [Oscillospiraceae bacterium]